ncbi:GPW/gp25 family protein [Actinomycetospora endophytica]|uniref:GPW/gp25 family protein n=1 Tax=Actinomycetospora endophytica TaxID=2291215 RepID=A0ABS8P683_9PSEU|nr:GPW/gp25 family protein [Actinomycetospora endophytica]MCD2193528.1 GPW/gp25 family protein [Actinomycetospora endophytica]
MTQPLPTTTGPQHFALPFNLQANGSYGVVDQDSSDDVISCVRVLLATRVGERLEVPQFGIPDPTFAVGNPGWPGVLENAVARWEPRAAGHAIPTVVHEDGTAEVVAAVPSHPGGPAV